MIDKTSIISKNAKIDSTCFIGPHCIIGDGVVLAAGCRLINNVVIQKSTFIGRNNIFYPFSVIGSDPQDLTYRGENTTLEIGDNNQFREYVTVHRGTVKQCGITKIGSANFFMAYSHIGHDCQIGDRVVIGSYAGIAGHVVINNDCAVLSKAAISQFVRVGKHAFISACSAVTRDIPPYAVAFGSSGATILRGANIRGLKEKGFSRKDILTIINIYKLLRGTPPFVEKLKRLSVLYKNDALFLEIKSFIEGSRLGITCFPFS